MTYLDTKLMAVGYVESQVKDASVLLKDNDLHFDLQVQAQQVSGSSTAKIIIDQEFEACIDGIDEFSHIIIIFLTNTPENARKTVKKVHPAGFKEAPLKGIFSSRSPLRPNPLGMSIVKLVGRRKNILEVEKFDAVDKTIILDIKPFIKTIDVPENSTIAPWVFELNEMFHKKCDEL